MTAIKKQMTHGIETFRNGILGATKKTKAAAQDRKQAIEAALREAKDLAKSASNKVKR